MRPPVLPPAMVLSAGLGTRLRPLTERCAKPLVPVGDRPALAHVVAHLRSSGVRRVVVNAHHLGDQVVAFARAASAEGLELSVSEEAELLGTAGGIARAATPLGPGDVLVWNGDILASVDVRALVAAHQEHPAGSAVATLVVQPMAAGQGPVGLDARGGVVRLRGDRFGEEVRGGQFLGVSVLGASLRSHLVCPGGLIEDVLVPALARGEPVGTFVFEGAWHDIGTLESYRAANLAWLAARRLPFWTGPGARVAAAVSLDATVVGAGASVMGQGAVTGCVVWPGATAVAPLRDQVVTT